MTTPAPQISLGDEVTGYGSDSVRTGFAKYNTHGHAIADSSSFFVAGIRIGDTVQGYAAADATLFPLDTKAEEVSASTLTVDKAATATKSGIAIQVGTKIILNCSTTNGSRVVTTAAQDGFIKGAAFDALAAFQFHGHIPYARNHGWLLVDKPGFAGLVTTFTAEAFFGSAELTLTANNLVIARVCVDQNLKSVPLAPTDTLYPGFDKNARLYIQVSAAMNTPDLSYSITGYRTLN